MDIGKAFLYVNEDVDKIKKVAIGAVLTLLAFILVPILFLMGYEVAIIRRVSRGEAEPLPEWENWGELFMDGLVVWAAHFVYALPIVLVSICSLFIWLPAATDNEAIAGAGIFGIVVLSCLAILFALALAFLSPALFIQYGRTGEFGSMFSFREVVAIARGNFVDILLVIVVAIAANFVLGLVSWIPVCGQLIFAPVGFFWIMAATGHLYGQIATKANAKAF